jgi:hypothetical protein
MTRTLPDPHFHGSMGSDSLKNAYAEEPFSRSLTPIRPGEQPIRPFPRRPLFPRSVVLSPIEPYGRSVRHPNSRVHEMIRKLKSGEYRLYSRKVDPKTGKRRNLGTFKTRAAAEKHEKAVQFFKRRG